MTKFDEENAMLADINQFMAVSLQDEFRPFAYYDKHLDCIRVQVRDCSIKEERLSRIFTMMASVHADTVEYVGFTIKGIRHLLKELSLPMEGAVKLASIIDGIVRIYPDTCVKMVQEEFGVVLGEEGGLEVDVNLAKVA